MSTQTASHHIRSGLSWPQHDRLQVREAGLEDNSSVAPAFRGRRPTQTPAQSSGRAQRRRKRVNHVSHQRLGRGCAEFAEIAIQCAL